MDVYKDFIQQLRKISFDEVHILLCDITPKLKEFVYLTTQVKFKDGSYHTFYGDVRSIISSFINYFIQTVDNTIKEADKFSNVITKDELMMLIEQTISIHESNQIEFAKDFLPMTSNSEKQNFEEVEQQYNDYIRKLCELRDKKDSIQKQDKMLEFVKEYFEIAVKKTSEMLDFTNTYLALMLADCLNKTRTSLEEILLRLSNNLQQAQDECENTLDNLMNQLYDKNKESLTVTRAERKRSIDVAEVNRGLQIIKNKIESYDTDLPLARLEEEVAYWQTRLKEFNIIADNIVKIKTEQENMAKQEQIYNTMRTTELPGSKRQCWENMGETFTKRNAYLKQKLIDEARAMITFFACKGTDRIFYSDNLGSYYVDEFNHQVYVFDYGLGNYHINCEGRFTEVPENLYYFDKHGRYIIQDGKRVYQCAPCTSLYNIEDNDLLTKKKDEANARVVSLFTEDLQCRRPIKDPNDVIILPDLDSKDITGTLDHETVKYLWDSFGSILPDALHDVATAKSKNPIHYLAHKILYHKYNRTFKELRQKKAEAEEFRANIFKLRKEKAIAISNEWKDKQVKRRKPEESDDTQERAVYNAQMTEYDFINSLNYYY